MKNSLKKVTIGMLGIVLSVSAFAVVPRADQPFMQAALADLKQAQSFLQKATADKGGHRQKAMDLTANAIIAVNEGIVYDRTHGGDRRRRRNSTDESFDLSSLPGADQPNMTKARAHLQSALANLNRASADKGGYRERAMGLINDAISEVNAGIEYDRTH